MFRVLSQYTSLSSLKYRLDFMQKLFELFFGAYVLLIKRHLFIFVGHLRMRESNACVITYRRPYCGQIRIVKTVRDDIMRLLECKVCFIFLL